MRSIADFPQVVTVDHHPMGIANFGDQSPQSGRAQALRSFTFHELPYDSRHYATRCFPALSHDHAQASHRAARSAPLHDPAPIPYVSGEAQVSRYRRNARALPQTARAVPLQYSSGRAQALRFRNRSILAVSPTSSTSTTRRTARPAHTTGRLAPYRYFRTAISVRAKAMNEDSIAFFITWTCYGTWLPGDERGWTKWHAGDQVPKPLLADWCQGKMTEQPVELNAEQQTLVEDVIREHCDKRGWTLHAVNCRSNHCHVVVTAPDYDGETVRDQFKLWGTRRLKQHERDSGIDESQLRERWWTRKGSVRWVDDEESLEAAILYTRDGQDRGGSKAN